MFTIKLYAGDGNRQQILAADSFTILRGAVSNYGDEAEITLHRKSGEDIRIDIKPDLPTELGSVHPPVFQKAIIENAAGRTTEIIALKP